MSEIKFSNFTNEDGSNGPDFVGLTTFTSPHYFVPPSGTTAQRPSGEGLAPGMLRFNTDIGRLEVWRGDHWATILGESPNLGISTNPAGTSGGLGNRGLFGARATPAFINTIDYITISSAGNAINFGDMSDGRYLYGSFSSSTRGVITGGNGAPSRIEYVTISSTGNSIVDSGTLNFGRYFATGCSNSTRGLTIGGSISIQLTTISSLGNSQDFGDLSAAKRSLAAGASSTRGIFAGGYINPGTFTVFNTIEYVTISTTGTVSNFGNLSSEIYYSSYVGSATRGVWGGGSSSSIITNVIEFVTITSLGNAQDFGDLYVQVGVHASCSSSTRGIFAGGLTPANSNVMQSISIQTTGNSIDFGDLTSEGHGQRGFSNGHGGL